jgi:homoserine dehydrogenase
MKYRLALIGLGNVGLGFAQTLSERGEELAEQFGLELEIVAVSDFIRGSVYNPDGIAPQALIDAVAQTGNLDSVPAAERGWDALETIASSNADVVMELTYTDLKTGEPAFSHIRAALESGKHVVTTNKGPVALRFPDLTAIAREKNVEIGVEGTVMSGTPTLRLGMEYVAAAGVQRIEGILNGTTNYILTQMEAGADYETALADAQEKGYAEADPTGDVEGHDPAGKVVILGNLMMGLPLTMADVDCTGITGLTADDIAAAKSAGERWKLIGKLEVVDGVPHASVNPERIPLTHPLASIGGATNAITYSTDLLGQVTLVGPGAGRMETGFALIVDLLGIHRKHGS